MRKFFSHPFVSVPGKLLARITYGGLWGIILSNFEPDVRLMYGMMVGLCALFLSNAFFGWDAGSRLDASRLALYGLHIAGEVLCVGAVVLMALAGFQGLPDWAYASCLASFGGLFACVYSAILLMKRNIAERRGSKP